MFRSKERQTTCRETKTVRISGVLLSVCFTLQMRNERLAGPEPYNSLVADARTGARFPDAQDQSLPDSYFLSLLVPSRMMDRYFNT